MSVAGDVRSARRLVDCFGRDSGCVVSFGDAVGLFPFFVGWGTFRTRISVSSFDLTSETRPSLFLCTPKERGERKAPERPCPCGQTSSVRPCTGHRRHLPSWQSLLGRRPCRPTPSRGARSRQGHTGTGESKPNALREFEILNRFVWSAMPSDSPCFDVRPPLIACLADVRLGGDGRQDAGQAALRRKRMAAGPVQACVREVARQGQAIRGARFFCIFLCAVKERCSGASPIQIESPCLESRPKPTTTLCRTQSSQRWYFGNVGRDKRSAPQRMQRRSCWGSLRLPQPTGAVTPVQACVREVLRPGQSTATTRCGRQPNACPRLRAGWQIGGITA